MRTRIVDKVPEALGVGRALIGIDQAERGELFDLERDERGGSRSTLRNGVGDQHGALGGDVVAIDLADAEPADGRERDDQQRDDVHRERKTPVSALFRHAGSFSARAATTLSGDC